MSIYTSNKNYFTCVTYSGSTCGCHTLRHTNNECGHKHRSEEAAGKCLNKLQRWSKDGQSCSATWYFGAVVEMESEHDTELVTIEEIDDDGDYVDKTISAYDLCKC